MEPRTSFGIAETDDYVKNILGRAGTPPQSSDADSTLAWLLPHVIHQESRGNPNAVSPKGALGRLQVMPATAANPGFGIAPAKDHSPEELERVGKSYLKAMIQRYPGRPDLALAAYNAGPGRADAWGGVHVAPGASPGGDFGVPLGFRAGAGTEGVTPTAGSLGELETVDRSIPKPTLRDYWVDVVGVDSSVSAIHNIAEDMGYKVDPSFEIGKIPAKQWTEITRGIPEEMQANLGGAVSMEHLQGLAARARAELAAEDEIAQFGGWGLAGRFALNMLDPANVAVGYASGGLGVASKATRLARAAEVLTAAKKFDEARVLVDGLGKFARMGTLGQTMRAGATGAVENIALESVLDQGRITRDGWDVANAGLMGALMGGTFSRIFGTKELGRLRTAYGTALERLNLDEAAHAVSIRRGELETRLKWTHSDHEVEAARRELQQLQERHAADLAEHKARVEAAARGSREALTDEASGALKRSELGQLRRTVEGLRKQSKEAATLEDQIRARMLDEDVRSMGADEAGTKQRSKMRDRAAKEEARARRETIEANLRRGEEALAKATKAQESLTNLRKVERRERSAPNDPLLHLDPATRDSLAERELAMVQRHQKELDATQGRLKAAEDARTAKQAKLQDELSKLDQVTAAAVRKSDAQVAELFGKDTAGAARFNGFFEGVHPHLDDDSGLPSANPVARIGAAPGIKDKLVKLLTFRKGPFATFSMILRGSPNDTVVNELGRLVSNSIGTENGIANTAGASEIAHVMRQSFEARFNQLVTPAYQDWCERNGIGYMQRTSRLTRNDFMSDVGRIIRGDTSRTDPATQKVAAGLQKIFSEYGQAARDAGVKGFENFEPNANYLPRVFDFHALHDIETRVGSGNLRLLVQKAIQKAHEVEGPAEGGGAFDFVREGGEPVVSSLSDNAAAKIADAYVSTMKELRVGANVGLMQGFRWDDVGFLREFLTDAKLAPDEINQVVNEMAALNARRNRQTGGSFRNAKYRVQMDENFEMVFPDQEALRSGLQQDITVKVSDLFENNVEALFGRYNRTVAGHVALARVGIKSRADFETSIKKVERELENDLDELNRVRTTAQAAYDLITGTPMLGQKAGTLARLGRTARDWNFTTTMGQSGWAQFPDLAGLLQKGYLGHTLKYFPEVMRTIRRTDGQIDVEFYREMESALGLGTDLFNNRIFSSFDWGEEGAGFSGTLGRVEHGLRVAGRGVQKASGLGFMTEMSQRLAGRVIVQRLVKDVIEGGALSEGRALQLGLDAGMRKRIAAQLKAHTEWVDGDFGGTVQIVNYAKWDDIEARDSMLHAVSREARRLVQEEDLGDTSLWMHTHWGKTLAQFRRFALVSYSRQILHGIAHADAEEATRVMLSMVIAAAAYKARHETALALKVAGGMPPDEEEKYREKFLSLDRLAAASFANSSYSSVLPGLWDTGQYWTTGTRMFDTRSSGLGSDIITGNPTYGLFSNINRGAQGIGTSIVRGDRQFDQGDLAAIRRLIPFQNVLGMDAPFGALASALPEHDEEDTEPLVIDYGFNDNQ